MTFFNFSLDCYLLLFTVDTLVDGTVAQLREDLKIDYLRMTVDSYALHQDEALAEERYDRLGEEASTYLSEVEFNP